MKGVAVGASARVATERYALRCIFESSFICNMGRIRLQRASKVSAGRYGIIMLIRSIAVCDNEGSSLFSGFSPLSAFGVWMVSWSSELALSYAPWRS
jgi:hypothetical protein